MRQVFRAVSVDNPAFYFSTISWLRLQQETVWVNVNFERTNCTEIYSVKLRIQSEYRKMRTRNNSVFGHFSRSERLLVEYRIHWNINIWKNKVLYEKINGSLGWNKHSGEAALIKNPVIQCQLCFAQELLV